MMNKFHHFHMVSISPWPIISALTSWNTMMMMTYSFYSKINLNYPILMMMITTLSAISWWKDVIRESTMQGHHQFLVMNSLKMGMVLFISSEILFFTSFFWAYFHSSISPTMEIGQKWPPALIKSFNPMNVPLLNTIILVSSGASVTWSHHSNIKNNKKNTIMSMSLSCLLGIYFTTLQIMEYLQAEFSISDASYGSTFFMATGFHGIHVVIGTIFLMTSLYRMMVLNNPLNHTIGFEMAIWYWHFVDIVWLLLYISIYWWGNN